jgi:aminoglycoside phosphotransferase (APT) family kinase protein
MGARPADIEGLVEAKLGCRVRSCESVTAGRMAATYRLDLDGGPGRVVCKVGGPSVRTGEVIEPLVLRLVGEATDLPVPAVLASGRVRDTTGTRRRFGLYEFCEGETPTPFGALAPATRQGVLRQVGSALGRLHAAHRFERTGGLARAGDGTVDSSHAGDGTVDSARAGDGTVDSSHAGDGTSDSSHAGDSLRICTPRGLHVPKKARHLLRWMADAGSVASRPVLTHGDLFPGNLLVDTDGRVTALLDWGNAHVTTAGYALARAEMRLVDWFRFPAGERRRLREALRAGYREHRPLPPDYPRLGSVHKLLWLVQSGERHLRHTLTPRGRRQLRDHVDSVLSSGLPG